jgi:ankyrin repeat protein
MAKKPVTKNLPLIEQAFIQIKAGDLEPAKQLLLRRGVNTSDKLNRTALMYSASLRVTDTTFVEWLFAQGANVNLQDKEGKTALHIAAREGTATFVQALLEQKADVDIKDNQGNTALWRAIMDQDDKDLQKVKLLVQYGANPDSVNHANRTPREILQTLRKKTIEDLQVEIHPGVSSSLPETEA